MTKVTRHNEHAVLSPVEANVSRQSSLQSAVLRPIAGAAGKEEEREQTEFLAEVAHQLLTPLTSIKAAVEVLQEEAGSSPLDPQVRARLVGSLARSVEVLESLINQLVQYGQLQMGGARLAPEIADVEEMVRACVAVVGPVLMRRAQSLRLEVATPLPLLALDVQRMEQAVLNVLNNASKFSPPGSEVLVTLRADDHRLVLAVRDACGGLSEGEMESLFRPYSAERRPPTSGQTAGAGLGLAIAKAVVELHGGQIEVMNTPGQGCTFLISLPFKAKEQSASV